MANIFAPARGEFLRRAQGHWKPVCLRVTRCHSQRHKWPSQFTLVTNDEGEKGIQTMRLPEMNKEFRTGFGFRIFAILVVLTLAEYLMVLVIDRGNLPWMIIMNIADAGLILYFFMHISQLWKQE